MRCGVSGMYGFGRRSQIFEELLRIQHARVLNEPQALAADGANQGNELKIGHFIANQMVSERAAEHRHRGVQRIQTGCDLHALAEAHRFAIRHQRARALERRPAVREGILDHEVFRALRIHERRNRRAMLAGENVHTLDAERGQ